MCGHPSTSTKYEGGDLLSLRLRDIAHGLSVQSRAMVVQQKTGQPVQFEITKNTRESISQLIQRDQLTSSDFLFKSRVKASVHLSTRQYSRIVVHWVESINLDATQFISIGCFTVISGVHPVRFISHKASPI
jgi:hypothetical protein